MLEHVADLGQGGFGSVMLMRHRGDERPLALKCLLRSAITKPQMREHVVSEKQLMVELRHPFLVNLIGTFKDSERLFLAMEYIIGGELFSYAAPANRLFQTDSLTQNTPTHVTVRLRVGCCRYMGMYDGMLPDDDQIKFVVGSVVLMMEHIHFRKFVYRDLKPENLMIDAEGYMKLIDFGFCKVCGPVSTLGALGHTTLVVCACLLTQRC